MVELKVKLKSFATRATGGTCEFIGKVIAGAAVLVLINNNEIDTAPIQIDPKSVPG